MSRISSAPSLRVRLCCSMTSLKPNSAISYFFTSFFAGIFFTIKGCNNRSNRYKVNRNVSPKIFLLDLIQPIQKSLLQRISNIPARANHACFLCILFPYLHSPHITTHVTSSSIILSSIAISSSLTTVHHLCPDVTILKLVLIFCSLF